MMTCQDYELKIGEAVDGALDAPARRALEAHLAVCERCRAVADELRAIRDASRTLERQVPQPHLWTRIAAAIDADRQHSWWNRLFGSHTPAWQQLAAATVAVVLTAGVVWMAWRDLSPAGSPNPDIVAVAGVDPDPQPLEVELKLAEDHYVKAITGLEQITKAEGTDLDPQTADVLQANLTVIDQAIDESRAALETQPASDVAQESLFEALRSKVALLQDTVALINEMRKGNQEGAARIVSGINQ